MERVVFAAAVWLAAHAERIVWGLVAYLILTAPARGAEPPRFVVVDRTAPRFVVVDRTAGADGYTGPAPAGQEWVRYPGERWQLRPLTPAAPAVAAPRPFPGTPATTPATPARIAAPHSTSFPAGIGTAPTITRALPAAPFGGISSCASPFG